MTESVSVLNKVVFTSAAAARVKELIDDEGNLNLKLRVYVQGGGCSGFEYGFTFDENMEEDDTKVETDGVILLIDPNSLGYLKTATIDYVKDVQGEQFVIRNPKAKTTCGCGSSFSVADEESGQE